MKVGTPCLLMMAVTTMRMLPMLPANDPGEGTWINTCNQNFGPMDEKDPSLAGWFRFLETCTHDIRPKDVKNLELEGMWSWDCKLKSGEPNAAKKVGKASLEYRTTNYTLTFRTDDDGRKEGEGLSLEPQSATSNETNERAALREEIFWDAGRALATSPRSSLEGRVFYDCMQTKWVHDTPNNQYDGRWFYDCDQKRYDGNSENQLEGKWMYNCTMIRQGKESHYDGVWLQDCDVKKNTANKDATDFKGKWVYTCKEAEDKKQDKAVIRKKLDQLVELVKVGPDGRKATFLPGDNLPLATPSPENDNNPTSITTAATKQPGWPPSWG